MYFEGSKVKECSGTWSARGPRTHPPKIREGRGGGGSLLNTSQRWNGSEGKALSLSLTGNQYTAMGKTHGKEKLTQTGHNAEKKFNLAENGLFGS